MKVDRFNMNTLLFFIISWFLFLGLGRNQIIDGFYRKEYENNSDSCKYIHLCNLQDSKNHNCYKVYVQYVKNKIFTNLIILDDRNQNYIDTLYRLKYNLFIDKTGIIEDSLTYPFYGYRIDIIGENYILINIINHMSENISLYPISICWNDDKQAFNAIFP